MKRTQWRGQWITGICILGAVCASNSGCVHEPQVPPQLPIPRELQMTTLPTYVIEPPDILLITTMRVVPKPPYRIQTLDALLIQVSGTLPGEDIRGVYGVSPDGTVNLGLSYGVVNVVGMTIPEAEKAITAQLKGTLKNYQVLVSLSQARGMQQIQGDHLVRMDGTIGLGVYGSVYVAGLTLEQARTTIEQHLSKYMLEPEISIDIYSYNSKYYYIISDRAGYGATVIRLPITGKDTVLDAISMIYGLQFMSSQKHIWVARPNGQDPRKEQIFPVDWVALSKGGSPETNYQLMPGDRLFIQSNPLIALNNKMSIFFAPFERIFGITLLGSSTVQQINSTVQSIQQGAVGTGIGGVR
jgi:polysaccharide biosynthesis/export protein